MTDNLQNNLLTIDQNGNIGATFTGLVRALGLSLPTPDEVTWTRPDGQVVASIHALDVAAGTQQDLIATAQAVASSDLAFARYGATDSAGAFSGIIAEQIAAGPVQDDQVNVQVDGGVSVALLDGAGQSGFLQLLFAPQKRVLAGGSGNFTWPGASALSNVMTVAHGLGTTPTWLDATPSQGFAGGDLLSSEIWADATNVYVRGGFIGGFQPPAGTSSLFYWKAIG